MILTTTATSFGVACAALVAWRLGGALGNGVLAGFFAGAAVTCLGIVRQRRIFRLAPARALQTMVEGFLLKLGVLVLAALVLILVPPLRREIDPAGFLLAYGAAVLLVLLPGTWDNARILKERGAQ